MFSDISGFFVFIIWYIQNKFVPLHREPALGMSAHQRRRVADIIKRRLLALVLVCRNPENFVTQSKRAVNAPWCV